MVTIRNNRKYKIKHLPSHGSIKNVYWSSPYSLWFADSHRWPAVLCSLETLDSRSGCQSHWSVLSAKEGHYHSLQSQCNSYELWKKSAQVNGFLWVVWFLLTWTGAKRKNSNFITNYTTEVIQFCTHCNMYGGPDVLVADSLSDEVLWFVGHQLYWLWCTWKSICFIEVKMHRFYSKYSWFM